MAPRMSVAARQPGSARLRRTCGGLAALLESVSALVLVRVGDGHPRQTFAARGGAGGETALQLGGPPVGRAGGYRVGGAQQLRVGGEHGRTEGGVEVLVVVDAVRPEAVDQRDGVGQPARAPQLAHLASHLLDRNRGRNHGRRRGRSAGPTRRPPERQRDDDAQEDRDPQPDDEQDDRRGQRTGVGAIARDRDVDRLAHVVPRRAVDRTGHHPAAVGEAAADDPGADAVGSAVPARRRRAVDHRRPSMGTGLALDQQEHPAADHRQPDRDHHAEDQEIARQLHATHYPIGSSAQEPGAVGSRGRYHRNAGDLFLA